MEIKTVIKAIAPKEKLKFGDVVAYSDGEDKVIYMIVKLCNENEQYFRLLNLETGEVFSTYGNIDIVADYDALYKVDYKFEVELEG